MARPGDAMRGDVAGFPVALLGLGFAGARLHLPALRRLKASVVLAVDPDPATHQHTAGIPTSRDWEDAIGCGALAVIIATPAEQHVEPALAALAAGKHVYVEKPMAPASGEAALVAQAAARSGQILQVGFAYRFHPLWQRLKRSLAAGELEQPLAIEAEFTAPRTGLGWRDPLLDLAIHHVDLASWLLGCPPAAVRANGPLLALSWDDGSSMSGRYAVGPPCDRVRIRAGTRTVELDRLRGWRLRGGLPLRRRLPPLALARARIANPHWEQSFELSLAAFLRAAAGSKPQQGAGPEAGVRSVAVIEAAVAARSSQRTERVRVPTIQAARA